MLLCTAKTGVYMRKLKLIQRLAAPIIMFATTQGVANDSNFQKQIKDGGDLTSDALSEGLHFTSRQELQSLIRSKRLKELKQFARSQKP